MVTDGRIAWDTMHLFLADEHFVPFDKEPRYFCWMQKQEGIYLRMTNGSARRSLIMNHLS
jgi:hypothetical protein